MQATKSQIPDQPSVITEPETGKITSAENLTGSLGGNAGNEFAGPEDGKEEMLSFRVRNLRGCMCSVTYQLEATVEETFTQLSGDFDLRMIGILCQGKRIPKDMRVSQAVDKFRGTWVTTLDPHCW